MISANDVLQVISEIHQFSMLLVELKDATTLGISRSANDKVSYFKVDGRLGSIQRNDLVRRFIAAEISESLRPLSVEQFLQEIEGRKAKHIWLETGGKERKELGFLSISELKSFLQKCSHR